STFTERMIIVGTTGNVGIGTTSPSEKLNVSGNILASGDIISNSDRTLKENIIDISGEEALSKVVSLSAKRYNLKSDTTKTTKIGYIAQEVEEILPEYVHISNE